MSKDKKKKTFTDYLAQAWGTAKNTIKRDAGRIGGAIGDLPTGVKGKKLKDVPSDIDKAFGDKDD